MIQTATCPEPGVYPGVPFEVYASWQAANNSMLKILDEQSPAHAKAYMDNPKPPSKAFEVGSMFHKLILESFDFAQCYAIAPECDKRTKAGKEAWESFAALSGSRTVIAQTDYDLARAMASALKAHKTAREFVIGGEPEVCCVWVDKETGVLCKARLDYAHRAGGVLVDVKTTQDASPSAFGKSIYNYGYHRQAAFYRDGWAALHDGQEASFVFVAAEKSAPFAVASYEADKQLLALGRMAYKRSLFTYKQCIETGEWPAYSQELLPISVPDWALRQEGLV